jgi:hypothetical protein
VAFYEYEAIRIFVEKYRQLVEVAGSATFELRLAGFEEQIAQRYYESPISFAGIQLLDLSLQVVRFEPRRQRILSLGIGFTSGGDRIRTSAVGRCRLAEREARPVQAD